ncbi:MAG: glycoside hydrolase family 5 protein [Polyangiaceae bacterium]|nr:glycoside hydrolase family 5 protein [Polyangiaceae bacterium]
MERTARGAALIGAMVLVACGHDEPTFNPPGGEAGTSGGNEGGSSAGTGGAAGTAGNAGAGNAGAPPAVPVWGIDCGRPAVAVTSPRWAGFQRGITLGNRLDAPSEGAWGPVLQEGDFDVAAESGFDHIRLPVRFDAHAETDAPYTVDESFLVGRVDWAVEEALDRGLNIILDFHNYEALHTSVDEQRERFLAIWQQIAEHYADAPDDVAFELLNEPNTDLTPSVWNPLASDVLEIIRQSNPDRTVLIDATEASNAAQLGSLEIPDDPNVVATFHFYEPSLFVFQGQEWIGPAWGTTGVVFPGPPPDPVDPIAAVAAEDWAAQWFEDYNTLPIEENPGGPRAIFDHFEYVEAFVEQTGIPVYMGEFYAMDGSDLESRATWVRLVREECERRQIGWAVWEDGTSGYLFDHVSGEWSEPLLDALTSPMSEASGEPCAG